ncbi:EAL domain-containing protein [Pseudomonas sp.]|uniref:EAL domain-containing response regulator n=1 Tax=Pseudomonas sp. TaxID=306 RepID=UPI002723B475|nr:EAL domain-containing response regulator [Pseudomonas sp.]MDO8707074.1 EAL domain-containing response regulator [Pseudomonas sp.]
MKASDLNFLVVEDDDFQRQMLVDMLGSLGATGVLEAADGRQALEVLHKQNTKSVDIVLCDLNMPEMDGMEFLRHLGNVHSNISIIVNSALDGALITSVGKMVQAYGLRLLGTVEKPATLARLDEMILRYETAPLAAPQVANVPRSFTLDEILQGVRDKQFEPFFQPKVDFATRRISGAEALARWVHPQHGVIAPYCFIPLLERAGKIDELTFLILEKAAEACRLLHDKGHALTISVNLSLVSLTDTELASKIRQVVLNAGIDPHYIILEITESAAMTTIAPALENLARLRMNGFGLSIDDYGTGYSSMKQITRIAFSELKIDQSFVKNITDDDGLRIVVESSIALARKLQMKSTAEGVETQQDWDTLKEMGCDTAQGYLIARPMNLNSFIEFCAGYSA